MKDVLSLRPLASHEDGEAIRPAEVGEAGTR